MNWISVKDRVPDNRREVLVWGENRYFSSVSSAVPGRHNQGKFLGVTKFNPSRSGGKFDIEKNWWWCDEKVVTHWAEIVGPNGGDRVRNH